MKAILTKYLGPTNYKGSRVTAWDMDGNRVTVSYRPELSSDAMHRFAAQALCDKMGWTGEMVEGAVKGGSVFVFVGVVSIGKRGQ